MKITPEQVATDQPPRLAKRLGWTALALAIVAAILFGLVFGKASSARQSERQALLALTPRQEKTKGYTSSASCRACHPSQYDSWHKSFHRTMTQLAGTNSVMGRFDGTEIVSGGLLYRVYQTNDQYWAEMPDPEIIMKAVETGRRINDHTYQIRTNGVLSMLDLRSVPRVNKRVVMTTGSHHYQTYWVEGSVQNPQTQTNETKYGNLLQTLPLVFLPKEQQWIPRDNAFMTAPNSKRMISQWNHHCIKCHSTAGNPGLVAKTQFDTRTAELGISCEACHGPAAGHADHYRSPLARYKEQFSDAPAAKVVNPAKLAKLITSAPAKSAASVTAFTFTKMKKRVTSSPATAQRTAPATTSTSSATTSSTPARHPRRCGRRNSRKTADSSANAGGTTARSLPVAASSPPCG